MAPLGPLLFGVGIGIEIGLRDGCRSRCRDSLGSVRVQLSDRQQVATATRALQHGGGSLLPASVGERRFGMALAVLSSSAF